MNVLFVGDLTDEDRVAFVQHVRGKLLESETLQTQATHNSKARFKDSPDLGKEIQKAVIEALDSYSAMSMQAINEERVRNGLREMLVDLTGLWEELRERGEAA